MAHCLKALNDILNSNIQKIYVVTVFALTGTTHITAIDNTRNVETRSDIHRNIKEYLEDDKIYLTYALRSDYEISSPMSIYEIEIDSKKAIREAIHINFSIHFVSSMNLYD